MKKAIILMAFAALLAACHRGENRGATGTETGTYQGTAGQGTTGSEGWSGSVTNTNSVVMPEQSPDRTGTGGTSGQPQTGPSGTGSDQDLNNTDQSQPSDQEQPNDQGNEPDTGTDNGMSTPTPEPGS